MDKQKERIQALQDELLQREAADILLDDIADEFRQYKYDDSAYDRPQLDKTLRAMETQHRKKRKWEYRLKAAKRFGVRAAVIFLVVFSAMSVLFLTVEAFRVKLLNLFARQETAYMDFGAMPDADSLRGAGFVLIPTQIPEGYRVAGVDSSDTIRRIQYTNADGDSLFFEQHDSGQMFSLDTEQYREEVQINGAAGYLIQLDGFTSIIWEQEGCFCVITGQMDRDTAIRMAESVQKL